MKQRPELDHLIYIVEKNSSCTKSGIEYFYYEDDGSFKSVNYSPFSNSLTVCVLLTKKKGTILFEAKI